MVGPKTFTFIQYVYKMAYHAFTNDIQNTISEINSSVHKISHVKKKSYACDGVYTYTPQLYL